MQMQAALEKGMLSLSQADVGSTLQVFFNLEELNQVENQPPTLLPSACHISP